MTEDDTYPHDLAGPSARPPVDPKPSLVQLARSSRSHQLAAESPETWGNLGDHLAALPPWRVAGCIIELFTEANARNPKRDKSSDGTIVGPSHTTDSDHYPRVKDSTGTGVVLAGDVDASDLPMADAVERARQLALAGKLPWLAYVIYSGRITAPDFSGWRRYTGDNRHVLHAHFSARTSPQALYDRRDRWGIFSGAPAPAPTPPKTPTPGRWAGPDLTGRGRALRGVQGNSGPRVGQLQAFLRDVFPAYRHDLGGQLIVADGEWGAQTTAWLRNFGHRSGIPEADGLNIGPKLAAALSGAGFDRTAAHARVVARMVAAGRR